MKGFGIFLLALVYTAGVYGQTGNGTEPTTEITPNTTVTIGPPVTTTLAPSTTIKPSGDDKAPEVKYYMNQTGTVCLMVNMAVKMSFTYNQSSDNATKFEMVGVKWDLPNDTKVDNTLSKCAVNNNNNSQLMVLRFFENWTLSLHFSKDKDKKVKMDNMTLFYMESDRRFVNISQPAAENVTAAAHNGDFTWSQAGFKCASTLNITGFNAGMKTKLDFLLTHDVQIEAFRSKKDTDFGKDVTYCNEDTSVSNIVPIAVGAALAGLVLIVLVAYLIGRSRNKRGYESV